MTLSLLLWWPVGGAKYRINGHLRFAEHLAYVRQHGLEQVVSLAKSGDKSFGQDPRGGPWVSVLRRDGQFAASYVRQDVDRHMHMMCGATCHHVGFPNDRQLEPDCPLASEDRRGPMRRVTVDRNAAGPFSTVHQATALRIT